MCWGRVICSQLWLLDFGLVAHLLEQSLMSTSVPFLSVPICASLNCSLLAVKVQGRRILLDLGLDTPWELWGSFGEQDLGSEHHLHLLPLPRAAFSFVNV